ncbi:MAG: 3-hydroxyacyl-CoA dehydrogenase NAD-binding domain-containing protein [Phycisphaerales bacterium]|nr:3-hydroxyacyl-CoA dehydrogenase NAD-binding domain-containing protein [Phycisphaerales bacterium]
MTEQPVHAIAVIGAGTMGSGIAQVAATHGCTVHLIDVNAEVLRHGLDAIKKNLDRAVEKGRMTAPDRDATSTRIHTRGEIGNLKDVELAIEAVVEDLAIKQRVFRDLEAATPPSAVLASNTSSLSVTKIAEALKDPGRVIGMHFFNPAPIMPLVEIIAGEKSAAAAVEAGFAVATAWGKTAVRAADTPGFIVNRVARGYYLEALRLLGEGVAGIDEIDNVCRVHGGFKMGPFELMDLVGLDVNLAVSTSVWEQMERHPRFSPHEIQQKLVEQGRLGRKTGRGFYAYATSAPPVSAYPVDRRSFQLSPLLSGAVRAFADRAGARNAGSTEQYVFARILSAILNEAALALDEGVASREDIDIAMQKGTNYPKGPLAWTDEIGLWTVRGLLRAMNDSVSDRRYAPAKSFADAG